MENEDVSASIQRVMEAVEFIKPDMLPRRDDFNSADEWGAGSVKRWRGWKGLAKNSQPADYYGMEMRVVMAEEGAFFGGIYNTQILPRGIIRLLMKNFPR